MTGVLLGLSLIETALLGFLIGFFIGYANSERDSRTIDRTIAELKERIAKLKGENDDTSA